VDPTAPAKLDALHEAASALEEMTWLRSFASGEILPPQPSPGG